MYTFKWTIHILLQPIIGYIFAFNEEFIPIHRNDNDFPMRPVKRDGLSPATIDIENASKEWCTRDKSLDISYNNQDIDCGRNYKLTNLFDNYPTIKMPQNADATHLYTLFMLDPDAPSKQSPRARNWLHWLVVNVPGNDLKSGTLIVDYNPPTPPEDSGRHRYIFVVLQQQGRIEKHNIAGRAKFKIKEYAKDHQLSPAIVGFTYFTTQNQSDE